jgi:integrating conjugative element membrane protein (TIGR03747 family)
MAVKTSQRQYSKTLILNLLIVVFLGGLILLAWSMSLWARFGFDAAQLRLEQLSRQQRAAIVPFNTLSINTSWVKLPTESISSKVREMTHALPQPNSELTRITYDALQMAKQFWLLVGMTAHVMLLKLTILLAAIPLFVLAMSAGLVDGLNQRAIRTASLGRESSYVFHQFNRLFKRGLVVLLGFWLAIPLSVTPALMLVPVSVLLSVMVSVTASRFKKYL